MGKYHPEYLGPFGPKLPVSSIGTFVLGNTNDRFYLLGFACTEGVPRHDIEFRRLADGDGTYWVDSGDRDGYRRLRFRCRVLVRLSANYLDQHSFEIEAADDDDRNWEMMQFLLFGLQ